MYTLYCTLYTQLTILSSGEPISKLQLTTMERAILKSLVALLLFMVLENVISTVVGPTLIFYIQSVGGSNDDYGLTTSAVCIDTTLMTFHFGKWIDSNGGKYQAPLSWAFILGILGSIIYYVASLLPIGFWGINAIGLVYSHLFLLSDLRPTLRRVCLGEE